VNPPSPSAPETPQTDSRRPRPRHSLRWQLTLSYLLLVGLSVVVLSLVTLWLTRHSFSAFVGETGRRNAQVVALFLGSYYQRQGESWAGVQEVVEKLRMLAEQRPPQAVPVPRSAQGLVLQQLRRQPAERVVLAGPEGRVLADSEGTDLNRLLPEATLGRGVPVVVGGRQVGTVVMGSQLGLLSQIGRAYLQIVNRGLPLVMLLVGGVAVLLGTVMARRIIGPVQELASAATRLAAQGTGNLDGDRYQPLPVRSEDELGEMSAAFNAMVRQIDEESHLRRQMVADIAHELRTPLSVMQLELEALEDSLQSPVEASASLRGEIDLLTQLVEDLAMLARTDAGEQALSPALADVGALARETARRWEGRASAQGVTLRTEIAPDLPRVRVDSLRITRVLANLLDNAFRYTPTGGEITVGVRAKPPSLLVTVRDTGEGIPSEELESVFIRFYRLDRARSRASGGRGLGLAIARQIIELHGGRIWAESSGVPGEGTTVAFTLPL